jgi:hypothetical protein
VADENVKVQIETEDLTRRGAQSAEERLRRFAEEASRSLETYNDRLAAISTERERAFSGMGDQLNELKKQLATAQVGGDSVGASQLQQQLIAMARPAVQAQRDALHEMSKDRKLSDDEYIQVKREQYRVENELRSLDLASHRASEEAKLNETRRAQQRQTDEVRRQAEARRQLEQSLQTMAIAGLAAGGALAGLVKTAQSTTDAFATQQRAFVGLSAVATAYGQSATMATQAAKQLTADGILPLGKAVASLRDLMTTGLNIQQATDLMIIFKDRAALGRAETVTFDQAVGNLAQSFKTEQSRIGDLSGMTENYSQILEVGAKQLGKNVSALTDLDRTQAKYLGIVQLSQGFLGGAAIMTDTLSGAQARLSTSTALAKAAIGEALVPVAKQWTEVATQAAKSTQGFAQANQEAIRTNTVMTGGALLAITALGGLAGAWRILMAAVGGGWIGAIAIGIVAATGALSGFITSVMAGAQAAQDQKDKLGSLITEYEHLRGAIDDTSKSKEEQTEAAKQLEKILQELEKINPELVNGWDLNTQALNRMNGELQVSIDKGSKWQEIWNNVKNLGAASPEVQMQNRIDQARNDLDTLEKMRETALTFNPSMANEIDAQWEPRIAEAREVLRQLVAARMESGFVENPEDYLNPDGSNRDQFRRGELIDKSAGKSNEVDEGDPFKQGLRNINFLLNTEQIATQAAIGLLEKLGEVHAKTEEQKMEIEEKVFALRKKARQEEEQSTSSAAQKAEALRKDALNADTRMIDHRLRMNEIDTAGEITELKRVLAEHELTNEERMGLQERLVSAQARLGKEVTGQLKSEMDDAAEMADERIRADIAMINHRQRIGELSKEQEIESLQEHLARETDYYISHADERRSIDERLYALRQDLINRDATADKAARDQEEADRQDSFRSAVRLLDHQLRTNQITAADEINRLQEILAVHELTSEERMSLVERLAQAQERFGSGIAKAIAEDMRNQAQALGEQIREEIMWINHRQRMGQTSKEEEIEALQEHLARQISYYERHAAERLGIEERIYSLQDQLRKEDERRQQETLREIEKSVREARQETIKSISRAEKDAHEAMKARQKEAVEGIQREIDVAEERLRQFDRQISLVDRLQKIEDARRRIADLKQAGAREDVLLADGTRETRIIGMDEAEHALAEAIKENERAVERQRLQDQVTNLKTQLSNLRDHHSNEMDAHKTHWESVRATVETGFDQLQDVQDGRILQMAGELQSLLAGMLSPWQSYVDEVNRIMGTIKGLPAAPVATPGGGGGIGGPGLTIMGTGGRSTSPHLALLGDRPETTVPDVYLPRLGSEIAAQLRLAMPSALTMPTMPMGGGGSSLSIQNLNLNLPNVTDAQGFRRELPGVLQQVGVDAGALAAFRRGAAAGRFRQS